MRSHLLSRVSQPLLLAFITFAMHTHAALFDHWTVSQVSTNSFELRDVIFANGVFVAVGGDDWADAGVILTSVDGVTWTKQNAGVGIVTSVAYSGGYFVTVGIFGGEARSPNGTNWTLGSGSTDMSCVVPVSSGFAALGDVGPVISSNGLNWSAATNVSPPASQFYDLAFPGVALANSRVYRMGIDPNTWTAIATNPAFGYWIFNIGNSRYFIPSTSPGTNFISVDRTNWTAVPTGLTNVLGKPSSVSGYLLAPAGKGFAVSRDGTNWTLRTSLQIDRWVTSGRFASNGRCVVTCEVTTGVRPGTLSHNAFIHSSPLVDIDTVASGNVLLSGITGQTYRVEFAPQITSGSNSWQTLTTFQLTNNPTVVTNDLSGTQKFYRAGFSQ